MSKAEQTNLNHAASELQRYLSDEIAPLMAAEYFEELAPAPPELGARVIGGWVNSQLHGPSSELTVSDLIYHALRKLHLLVEYKLVPREMMLRYIEGAGRVLIQACPPDQQHSLKLRLSRLGESDTVIASRADFIHREAGPEEEARVAAVKAAAVAAEKKKQEAKPPDPKTIDRGARALTLLLERMAKIRIPENAKFADNPDVKPLAHLLATAALESKTDTDLNQHLEQMRGRGIEAPMGQVFRALGWSLPGWTAVDQEGDLVTGQAGRSLEAMNRIVALAPDSLERAKRWGEMIYAAIEQLNEGRIAQAVSILEAAKRLIAEKHPDPTTVANVLTQAEGAIAEQVLRRLVETPGKQNLLRLVLQFFPGLRPDALLDSLNGEKRRDRRKLVLALIECHGTLCRDLIVDRLAATQGGAPPDEMGYYRRNLAFLLRRIPRKGHERLEEEMGLLEAMIGPGQPVMSAKEAIGALGQIPEAAAERALAVRLNELESELPIRGGDADAWEVLDRLCAALARHGTVRAIRTIAGHAFKRHHALGDASARFEHLAWVDLSVDPEQLVLLLRTIRETLPGKVLGLSVSRPSPQLTPLIQAISGTPTQEVRALLEEIRTRYRALPLGEQAERILVKLEPKPVAAATNETLNGDLELFGLPNLLQSLQGSQATGELLLLDKHKERRGSIHMIQGRITTSEAAKLKGVEAIYLLFEKPFPGTFTFRTPTEPPRAPSGPTDDPLHVILEGARRHDEYQQSCAIAPDGLRLEPVGVPAIRPEEESDGEFAGNVWDRAAAGTTPEDCEYEMTVDPYRVRKLYAFWIEQGALRARTESAPTRA